MILTRLQQKQQFYTCFARGYNDAYLCEGCSFVASCVEDEPSDMFDADCGCTCCWYQYLFNYCFKNLCTDMDEYVRIKTYLDEVCEAAPLKEKLQPYIESYENFSPTDRITMFYSDEGALYRSLEADEKEALFGYISDIFDFDTLSFAPEALKKRSLDYNHGRSKRQKILKGEKLIIWGNQDERINFASLNPEEFEDVEETDFKSKYDVSVEEMSHELFGMKKRSGEFNTRDLKSIITTAVSAFLTGKKPVTSDLIQEVHLYSRGDINVLLSLLKDCIPGEKLTVFTDILSKAAHNFELPVIPETDLMTQVDLEPMGLELTEFFDTNDLPYLRFEACRIGLSWKKISDYPECNIAGSTKCGCMSILIEEKCFEEYLKDQGAPISQVQEYFQNRIQHFCGSHENGENQGTFPHHLLDDEEQIAWAFSLLNHLKTVASKLRISEDLDEFEAQYLFDSSVNQLSSSDHANAAVTIDKCELSQKDLIDYMLPQMDDCDIRGLYKCKNKNKKTTCIGTAVDKNQCNNACCLEIEMARCAESFCDTKWPVIHFMRAANLICFEYADKSFMNGQLPFPSIGLPNEESTVRDECPEDSNNDDDADDDDNDDHFNDDSKEKDEDNYNDIDDCIEPECDEHHFLDGFDDETNDENSKTELTWSSINNILKRATDSEDDYYDVKSRVGEPVCEIEPFDPGFDNTSCDKKQVKTCIKDGIQMLKDEPRHFCPYCQNDNAYDECRCACCFGKYFSKVCYDPNCEDVSERLRYKRYVRGICKVRPVKVKE